MSTATAAPGWHSRFGGGARMLGNETSKALQVMWVSKTPLVLQVASLTALYWAFQFFLGGGRLVPQLLAMTFVAYLAYIVAYIALLRMASGLLEEMYTGTLEQSLLSPLPPWVQSLGRLAAALVEGLVTAAVVTLFYFALFAIIDVDLAFSWSALVPVALVLADIAGFAMLIGGLALIVNTIGAVIHVIQSIISLLNGAFIPIFVLPASLAITSKIVIPTTLGLDATRRILTDGASVSQVWADGTLPAALAHAAALLVLGWTVYTAAIRRGLRDGRLGA